MNSYLLAKGVEDSLVDIAMSYGLNGRDSIPGRGK
jgi:hypothetical protein